MRREDLENEIEVACSNFEICAERISSAANVSYNCVNTKDDFRDVILKAETDIEHIEETLREMKDAVIEAKELLFETIEEDDNNKY